MCKPVCVFVLTAMLSFSGCGGYGTTGGSPGPTPNPPRTATKSAKRGIAYDLASPADLAVLSPGVSWWYNWSPNPNAGVPSDYLTKYSMDFYPMLWNGNVYGTREARPALQQPSGCGRNADRTGPNVSFAPHAIIGAQSAKQRLERARVQASKLHAPGAPNPARRESGRTICRRDRRAPCGLAATPLSVRAW